MKTKSSIKQNKFKIDLDPYGALLTVILTDNVPEATKKYNQAKEVDNSDLAVFIYEVPDNRKYCIILDYKATPIGHIVDKIWDKLQKVNIKRKELEEKNDIKGIKE